MNSVYNALRLNGYYGNETSIKVISGGFDNAWALINHIKPKEDLPPEAFLKPSLYQRYGSL